MFVSQRLRLRLAVITILLSCLVRSQAYSRRQGSVFIGDHHARRRHRWSAANGRIVLPASSRSSYRTKSPALSYSPDYSNHFLDDDEWMGDKRSRLYTVDLKSRKPGKLSWTTRIAWMTGMYGLYVKDSSSRCERHVLPHAHQPP